ncbi:hypothetical protein G7Y89_g12728 [Cudoniella acicularis]|uniref:N-acetylglucosamine-induced protein 1 n=1 Tax=Cudoniella acicularis TaxID=354080 RepID=A0A8H4VWP8_9HELO|nr:hypothetical protein G7Y89_g12728 [Cudoniella acicularis]
MKVNPKEEPSFALTGVDEQAISQTDKPSSYITWEELRTIIQTNNLSILKRTPSDLCRYREWAAETKAKHGSLASYLLAHRLPKTWGTPPFSPASTTPIEDPSDYRVLLNDWLYGFSPNVRHMIVWTSTAIPTDSGLGDMTAESRNVVKDFVRRHFVDGLGDSAEEKVVWFKNWGALQSVKGLEHIHVLVRDVDSVIVEKWIRE